jgi:hypothetical protein
MFGFEIIAGYFALLGVAQLAVRMTPTKKDDRFVSKLATASQAIRNGLLFSNGRRTFDTQGSDRR